MRKFDELICPIYIVLGGNILNEINWKNRHKFDELFPPNYTILGGIIFNEANQRNMHKFDKLFPPNYNVLGGIILNEINIKRRTSVELFPLNYVIECWTEENSEYTS